MSNWRPLRRSFRQLMFSGPPPYSRSFIFLLIIAGTTIQPFVPPSFILKSVVTIIMLLWILTYLSHRFGSRCLLGQLLLVVHNTLCVWLTQMAVALVLIKVLRKLLYQYLILSWLCLWLYLLLRLDWAALLLHVSYAWLAFESGHVVDWPLGFDVIELLLVHFSLFFNFVKSLHLINFGFNNCLLFSDSVCPDRRVGVVHTSLLLLKGLQSYTLVAAVVGYVVIQVRAL